VGKCDERTWTVARSLDFFNVHGSVHRKYIPIYIHQDATLHSLFISGNYSTCFGWYLHPSSGAHTTVSTAYGIFHTVTATCRYGGRRQYFIYLCITVITVVRPRSCPIIKYVSNNFLLILLVHSLTMVTLQQSKRVAEIYNCYIQNVHGRVILLCISETQQGCHTLKNHIATIRSFLIMQ